jgi:L-iditol 2-dehydrogenase
LLKLPNFNYFFYFFYLIFKNNRYLFLFNLDYDDYYPKEFFNYYDKYINNSFWSLKEFMKAAVFKGLEEKIEIISDYPKPVIDQDEVLINVKYTGICGTDMSMYFHGLGSVPIVMGHEFSGIIAEVGENVSEFKPGDEVSAWADMDYFGTITDGAMGEYMKVKAENVVIKPPDVSFETMCLAEPVSCLVHARNLSRIGNGEGVIILGSGVIGLCCLQVLLATRAPKYVVMIDLNENLLRLARELGATECFKPLEKNKIRRFLKKNGASPHVFDCAGTESSYLLSLDLVKPGGTVTLEGIKRGNIPIPLFLVIRKEITVKGSYCETRDDFLEAIELIRNKKINTEKMISDIVPLEKVNEAFERLKKDGRTDVKILVKIE